MREDQRDDHAGRVEIGADRIDDRPTAFSGGMRQRLQIAKNMVTRPRLVFMDEPTVGLDVPVQARLLDLIRGLVAEHGLAATVSTPVSLRALPSDWPISPRSASRSSLA